MSLSLYEQTATAESNVSAEEEKTLHDFYSSPLDRNGVRCALDKVSTVHNTLQLSDTHLVPIII